MFYWTNFGYKKINLHLFEKKSINKKTNSITHAFYRRNDPEY